RFERPGRLLPFPDLGLAEEGDAAGHLEAGAAFQQLHLGLVDLALVGLEHGAAGEGRAVRAHAADDFHAGDRLVPAVVAALVAGGIGAARIDQLDDPAGIGAVGGLGDFHDRLRPAGLVVDRLPAAHRAGAGLREGGDGGDGEGRRGGGDQDGGGAGHAHGVSWAGARRAAGRPLLYPEPAPKRTRAVLAHRPCPCTGSATRSELVLHADEAGAAVQVVLRGEGRDVAVTRVHTVGDQRRGLVEQVTDAHEDGPVGHVVADRSAVVEATVGTDVTPRILPTLVGVGRV